MKKNEKIFILMVFSIVFVLIFIYKNKQPFLEEFFQIKTDSFKVEKEVVDTAFILKQLEGYPYNHSEIK